MVSSGLTPVTDPTLLQQLERQPSLTPVDPTTAKFLEQAGGWSLTNSPIGGFLRGLRDPIDQGAALLTHGISAIAPQALQPWAQAQQRNVEDINRNAERDYTENWRGGAPPGFDVSRLAGNVAATAPIAFAMPGAAAASMPARIASGAATGAVSGALEPTGGEDFWQQTARNAATGGALGGVAPVALNALSRLVRPNAVDRVAPLMEAGVRPTPGQILGGPVGRLEEAVTSIPIAGDFAKSGRARAVGQFDVGAINNALAPIGQKLEAEGAGREAIVEMGDKIRDAYHAAVPQAGGILDQQALQDLVHLNSMSSFMPADRARQFQEIMRRTVMDKLAPNGGMTGESFKEAESDLGKLASPYLYSHNATSDERQLGGALRELQSTLRSWLQRVNPGTGIPEANAAYARMLRVENAATRSNQEPGAFTPAQLLAGIKKYSGAHQFARGEGLMQPYAEAGQAVLGNKLPDSGTPFRSLATIMGAAALGHGVSPEAAIGAAGAGAGAAALYSPLGQSLVAHLLASRPGFAAPLAKGMRQLAPVGSAAAPWAYGALAP
jgi:hypothetical protein